MATKNDVQVVDITHFKNKYKSGSYAHGVLAMLMSGPKRVYELEFVFYINGTSLLTNMRRLGLIVKTEGNNSAPFAITPLGQELLDLNGAFPLEKAWQGKFTYYSKEHKSVRSQYPWDVPELLDKALEAYRQKNGGKISMRYQCC